MMIWLELIVGALVVAVVTLLATPIKIRAVLTANERKIAVRFLGFGQTTDFAAGVKVIDWLGWRVYHSTIKVRPEKKKKPPAIKPARKKPVTLILKTLYAFRHPVGITLKQALRYLARLLTSPRLRLVRLDIIAGSNNPAITGMYYGWYNSLRPAWASEKVIVNWQPVFDRGQFSASFDGLVWLRPWEPVKHTVRLIYELPKIALYRLHKELKKKEA